MRVSPSQSAFFCLRGSIINEQRGKIVLDRTQYVALGIDTDGEINLIRKDGMVEVLFPRRSVVGMSTVSSAVDREPISWIFFFSNEAAEDEEKARKLHFDYLGTAD